ncbi:MAG: hypothetical protein PSX71_03285 [bacterium]|nr:hypothetical protein [bacterium]
MQVSAQFQGVVGLLQVFTLALPQQTVMFAAQDYCLRGLEAFLPLNGPDGDVLYSREKEHDALLQIPRSGTC